MMHGLKRYKTVDKTMTVSYQKYRITVKGNDTRHRVTSRFKSSNDNSE